MKHSDDLKILASALAEFQKEPPKFQVDATGQYQNKYASLGAIVHAAGPELAKHGLSVVQLPSGTADHPTLVTLLLHESGAYIESEAPLMLEKTNAQGLGSALTYQRRYSYCAALGLVADPDDDGAAASTEPENPVVEKFKNMDPPPSPNPNDITQPQINKIRALLNGLGMGEGSDLITAFKKHCPGQEWPALGLHGLTKSQASSLIDGLK